MRDTPPTRLHARPNMVWLALFCIAVSLMELFVFKQPDFYTLFSVGATILFVYCHDRLAPRGLFENWNGYTWSLFFAALLFFCVIIDQTGMRLGFWHYPHYGPADELRKYIFEWAAALLYHMAAYRAGVAALRRLNLSERLSALLSMLVGVTIIGLITEWLNLHVLSWEVLSMPFTDFTLGPFFLVFQTIGYWLMVIFPYGLYLVVNNIAVQRSFAAPDENTASTHAQYAHDQQK